MFHLSSRIDKVNIFIRLKVQQEREEQRRKKLEFPSSFCHRTIFDETFIRILLGGNDNVE